MEKIYLTYILWLNNFLLLTYIVIAYLCFFNFFFRINYDNVRSIDLIRSGWENGQITSTPFTLQLKQKSSSSFQLIYNGQTIEISGKLFSSQSTESIGSFSTIPTELYATIGHQSYHASVVINGSDISVFVNGQQSTFKLPTVNFTATSSSGNSGCQAPMAGKVTKVNAQKGQHVKKG